MILRDFPGYAAAPSELFSLLSSAGDFYGGFIGALVASAIFFLRHPQLPRAVTFTEPDAARIGGAPLGVPLHPVQLYESIVCLALFAVLGRLQSAQAVRRRGHLGLYDSVRGGSVRPRVLPR